MRRRAEAVEAELACVPGDAERSPANEAGAEQRRKRDVAADLAERKGEPRVGDRRRREPAVSREAREDWLVAEVLAPILAVGARAASVAEPGDADAFARRETRDIRADRVDPANDLVTGDDRQHGVWQLAVDDVQIGPAYAAGQHLHPDLARAGLPVAQLGPPKLRPQLVEYHRVHGYHPLGLEQACRGTVMAPRHQARMSEVPQDAGQQGRADPRR